MEWNAFEINAKKEKTRHKPKRCKQTLLWRCCEITFHTTSYSISNFKEKVENAKEIHFTANHGRWAMQRMKHFTRTTMSANTKWCCAFCAMKSFCRFLFLFFYSCIVAMKRLCVCGCMGVCVRAHFRLSYCMYCTAYTACSMQCHFIK